MFLGALEWIFTVADDATAKMVPIEAEIDLWWIGTADAPPPGEDDVTDLTISIVSTYPIDNP